MLAEIVQFSLRFRGVVIALAMAVLVYGVYSAARAKLDVFPEFVPPQVVVQTEAPGLAPEQVEQLVTRPVENAINGVSGLTTIRSQSIQGLSLVTAVFDDDTDIFRDRQRVSERLIQAAANLPAGVESPTMAPLTSSTNVLLVVGLTSTSCSPLELRTFADYRLRPRLLGVPGVAKVVTYGGRVRQLQIEVLPERLVAYGLGFDDVLAAARQAAGVRGAGFVDTDTQRIVLHADGQPGDADALGQVVVAQRDGIAIRLRDVARIDNGPAPRFGDAAIQGTPGIAMIVSGQVHTNTLEVTRAVERVIDDMRPLFQQEHIIIHPRLFRPANFIETAMRNVRSSLLIGAGLVALVLLLFLLDLRTAFISMIAIPLSLLAAVIVLDHAGITLNTMTLGGLTIALGEVVDDAIIDVENISRRLRENAASPAPRPRLRIVLDASLEVRGAVVYATFIVAMVFVPVLTMPGVAGRFFRPLAMGYILAILASLAVALTVTPALSCWLLRARAAVTREAPIAGFVKSRYRRLLATFTARPNTVLVAAACVCLAALATLPLFGGEFLPEFSEGNYILHMAAAPGTSLDESLRIGRHVAKTLLADRHVRAVTQRVGRAELGDDVFGTHYSEFDVDLEPLAGEEPESVTSELRRRLREFPGVAFALTPFLTERIEETVGGATAPVVVRIFGDDLGALNAAADHVAGVLKGIPGAADVQVLAPPGIPQLSIHLRPERLRQFGVRPAEVLSVLHAAYQGAVVGQVYEGVRVIDMVVTLDRARRREPEQVSALLIRSPRGRLVTLGTLADIRLTTGNYAVLHEGAQRCQVVTCNVVRRDVRGFAAEVRRRVRKDVEFPKGTYPVFAGTAQARRRAQQELLMHSGIALLGVILLLAIALRRRRNLVLVLTNLPFALVGGVLAVFALGGSLSIGALVGFVTLFGITVRNSILLVSHYEHLVRCEGMTWGARAALRGATERVVPILMTAATTMLGLLPLAIGCGAPGREIDGPMAIVILGGLATSTMLNLVVLPTLTLRFGSFTAAEEEIGDGC